MDSMLVVCYSETGVARQVAGQLCAEHGWPLGEVHDLRDAEPVQHPVREVVDSLLLRRAPITYDGPQPGDFRTVVLVTGMKAGHLPAAMRSFVLQHHDELRRYAVVSILKSEDATSAVAELTELLGHAPIHNAIFPAPEIFGGSAVREITAFGEFLLPHSASARAGLTVAGAR
jgi:hypothetical protein